MRHLLAILILATFSFGSYAGFDAGGGPGKIAILLSDKSVDPDGIDPHSTLGVEAFSDVVKHDTEKNEIIIDMSKLPVADATLRKFLYRMDDTETEKVLDRLKQMANTGDISVMVIDFVGYKVVNEKLILFIKENLRESLKIYQIYQNGELLELTLRNAFDIKSWNDSDRKFSIHVFKSKVTHSCE